MLLILYARRLLISNEEKAHKMALSLLLQGSVLETQNAAGTAVPLNYRPLD